MKTSLEVLFTPADFEALKARDLKETVCVVFDVLRATSSMVTALAHRAEAIIPVSEIPEAVAIRRREPRVLLAGERNGVRIPAELAEGIEFDLGNSPREFTAEKVAGRTIVMTTTNGTRALRACAGARRVLAGAFLNLGETAGFLGHIQPAQLLLVCSGTFEQPAYEDTLAAGALCDLLWKTYRAGDVSDSALMALRLYRAERADLPRALARSRNGKRLLANRELRDDVPFCAQRDLLHLVAQGDPDGAIRMSNGG